MDLSFLVSKAYLFAIVVAFMYVWLRVLFRRSIVCWSDPLHVSIVMLSFYLAYIGLPIAINVGQNYFVITALLVAFLFVAAIPGGANKIRPKTLDISPRNEMRIAILLLLIVILDLIINYVFGYVPILEGGGNTRYLAGQNNRVLTWLVYGMGWLPLVIWVFSSSTSAKWISGAVIGLLLFRGLLNGSKAALFYMLFILINYHFLITVQGEVEQAKKVAKWVALVTFMTVLFLPLYLVWSKMVADPRMVVSLVSTRLMGGFDQLIYVTLGDLPLEDRGLSLLTFYFLPFLKLFGYYPEYNNISELLMAEALGASNPKEMMLPNSNLILEAIWTNGIYIGGFLIVVIAYVNFSIRKIILKRESLRIWDLILFEFFVMNPLWWFLSGQEFAINLLLYMAAYLFGLIYLTFRSAAFLNKLKFRIY